MPFFAPFLFLSCPQKPIFAQQVSKKGVFSMLRVKDISLSFGTLQVLNGVSLHVGKGEVVCLCGESGCGKTTTGRSIIKIYDITSGNVYFKGQRICAGTKAFEDEIKAKKAEIKELKKSRPANAEEKITQCQNRIKELKEEIASAKADHKKADRKLVNEIQMIFQDPIASLDPRMTVRDIIAEGLVIKGIKDKEYIDNKVFEMLETVGLVREHASRYPHEFSGGQRQRICVAKALVLEPKLIVCDEPVSALDVSIQAQLLNLMNKLQADLGVTFIFIAHDLSVVQYMSDRIGVMYLGNMVELADADELYNNTMHPYTEALLSAVPVPVINGKRDRIILEGDVPSPMNPPTGCPFHPRCTKCMEICKQEKPQLQEKRNGHFVACHLFDNK
mgnify:CR=1 FL=1